MTGSSYERDLATLLHDADMAVMRAPSSGGGTEREMPDVLAGDRGYMPWAIELKSGSGTTLYVDAEEIAGLETFAKRFGARPYLAARYTDRGSSTAFYIVPPNAARITDTGNYGLPIGDIANRATHIVTDDGIEDGGEL